MTDARWHELRAARGELIRAFGDDGVRQIEYVSAFPDPRVWVWLCTETDDQRDRLVPRADQLRVSVAQLLSGIVDVQITGVTVQSQETVNRDHGGNWSHALR